MRHALSTTEGHLLIERIDPINLHGCTSANVFHGWTVGHGGQSRRVNQRDDYEQGRPPRG